MRATRGEDVLRLFPGPQRRVPLHGLYLNEPFAPPHPRSRSFVYTNFLASLDGRISLPDPQTHRRMVPPSIANARDWRLFQELAACADALVTTGSYVRELPRGVSARSFPVSGKPEYSDLLHWRRSRALTPQPAVVIVTASLDLPRLDALTESGRFVYIATGRAANTRRVAAVESQGARVLHVGRGTRVEGGSLVEALALEGHSNIAMLGGGQVLEALLVDDVLDRLYLTLAFRMLGGLCFDTMLTGPVLEHAARFRLKAMHYDAEESDVEQIFTILDRATAETGEDSLHG